MSEIKFDRYPAFITSLCHTYLITTFKKLCKEYWPIYWILEFSYSPLSVSALAAKILYRSGPNMLIHWHEFYSPDSLWCKKCNQLNLCEWNILPPTHHQNPIINISTALTQSEFLISAQTAHQTPCRSFIKVKLYWIKGWNILKQWPESAVKGKMHK